LDKGAIYRKTEKGLAEISSSERTVDRRLRPLLILVDGNRTANSIHALISGIGIREEDFDQLASTGYIEPVARPDQWLAANDGAVPFPDPVAGQRRSSLERFADGQRYLNETATDKLGLWAFFFVLKIEKCSSADDLMALLPQFEQAIAKKLDKAYAVHCRRIAETILRA
jgi:hypothetical protein